MNSTEIVYAKKLKTIVSIYLKSSLGNLIHWIMNYSSKLILSKLFNLRDINM